nr:MAG TPA: hypothetical protein [Caudoviricetes sp.]
MSSLLLNSYPARSLILSFSIKLRPYLLNLAKSTNPSVLVAGLL